MSKAWGIAAIVAGAAILGYLWLRGRKSASSSGEIPAVAPAPGSSSGEIPAVAPAPGESITKTIAPGTTQTVSAWETPTGQTGYAQTTTTISSGPAWEEQISYASPSTAEGIPIGGGEGVIIAVNKKTGQVINTGGHHIYWT